MARAKAGSTSQPQAGGPLVSIYQMAWPFATGATFAIRSKFTAATLPPLRVVSS